ncbi:MAG: DUF3892 domain-containing protein [Actinomycetota bacterium]
MVLPAGYDIGVAIATSGLTETLMARLRLGQIDPNADGAIDPETGTLGTLGYRIFRIEWLPAADRGPAECWLSLHSDPQGDDLSILDIGLTLTLTTDAAGSTSLGVVFREALTTTGPMQRAEIGSVVDLIEGTPLLDVTTMMTSIATALGVTLTPTTAFSTGLLAGDGTTAEPAIGVLASEAGISTWAAAPVSWIHPRRHVAVAFGGPFIETTVVPAAIAAAFGPLPATVQPSITLHSLAIASEPDQLRLSGSAAHSADPGVGTVLFGGPLRPWYSQVGRSLVVNTSDIDAAMPISWLLVLLGPVGVFLAAWIDTAIDTAVRSAVRGALAGLLGDLDPSALAPGGDATVRVVTRWASIEGGSLVLGLSLHAGPKTARIVATSGRRRLRLVQLDDDDVLSVADTVDLIDAGVLDVADVHVVRSATTGRAWLRADRDNSEGNNLRSLPAVDTSLIPPVERAPS